MGEQNERTEQVPGWVPRDLTVGYQHLMEVEERLSRRADERQDALRSDMAEQITALRREMGEQSSAARAQFDRLWQNGLSALGQRMAAMEATCRTVQAGKSPGSPHGDGDGSSGGSKGITGAIVGALNTRMGAAVLGALVLTLGIIVGVWLRLPTDRQADIIDHAASRHPLPVATATPGR